MDHLQHFELKSLWSGHRLITGFCLLWSLLGCEAEPPQHLVEEGKLLMARGDYETARVQFQNALQIDPKLADAYFHLAIVEERKQDWARMLGDLLETVAIDPRHLEARLRLGQIYFSGGQIEKAEEQAKTVLQLDAENQTGRLLQAAIWLSQGKPSEAKRNIELVLAKQPYAANAMGLQAKLLLADKQADAALAALTAGVGHNPDDRELRLLKISLESERNHVDEAVADYQVLIRQHRADPELPLALARLLISAGRTEDAERALRTAIQDNPNQLELTLQLADLLERREPVQAERLLQDLIARNPTQTAWQFRLADYYVGQRRFKDARALLAPIADGDDALSESLVGKIKLAEIALSQNDLAEVARLAERILSKDPQQSEALMLRAGMRLHKRDADGAISDLRVVLRNRPNSTQALLLLAQASLLKGQSEVAESYWRKLLDIEPANIAALVPLVSELIKRGGYAVADEVLTKAIAHSPDAPAPIELLIQTRLANRDWSGVAAATNLLRALPNADSTARYWEAQLAETQGNIPKAIRHYQELLAAQPSHPQALQQLRRLFESSGRRAEWIGYLLNLIAKNPNSLPALYQLVDGYSAEERWPEAEKWLIKAIDLQPGDIKLKLNLVDILERQNQARAESLLKEMISDSPHQAEYKIRLADYYAKHARNDDAIVLFQQVMAAENPNDVTVLAGFKLAQVYQRAGDLTKAESVLEKMLESKPDNIPALSALTAQLSKQSQWLKALQFIERAEQQSPQHPQIVELRIQMHLANRDWPSVKRTIAELGALPQAEISAKMWEAKLAIAQGKPDDAVRAVSDVLRNHPDQQALYLVLADAHLLNKNIDSAIEVYDQVLRKFPDNDQAANNLAELLVTHRASRGENIDKALRLVDRFKDSSQPEVLDTYAWVHLKAGNLEKSLPALQKAAQASPQNAAIYYHLGEAYRRRGDVDKAVGELEKSLSLAEKYGDNLVIEPVKALLEDLR